MMETNATKINISLAHAFVAFFTIRAGCYDRNRKMNYITMCCSLNMASRRSEKLTNVAIEIFNIKQNIARSHSTTHYIRAGSDNGQFNPTMQISLSNSNDCRRYHRNTAEKIRILEQQ